MSDSPIFPRESFLLGLCSGEYRSRRQVGEDLDFMTLIKNRLLPFFPSHGPEQSRENISPDEKPDDVEWKQFGEMRIGYAKSQSDSVFQCYGDTTYRHHWSKANRRFFLEQLIRSLRPYMRFKSTMPSR